MGLFISCDEATSICDKSQYGEASFLEIVKLRIHFLKCKICALYTKQNTMMTKICDHQLKDKKSKVELVLSDEEKSKLKEQLSQIE